MKYCVVIRGKHDHPLYKNSFINYTQMLLNPLREISGELSIFLLTYESPHMSDLLADYKPVKTLVLDQSEMPKLDGWNRQKFWHRASIEMIHEYEQANTMQFDFFINIRFDLLLTPNVMKRLVTDKINICYKHPSGNCDDNLFLFPRIYLADFKNAVDQLIEKDRITHEICHFLPESNIHYLCVVPYSGGIEWKEIFDLIRK